MNESRPEDDDGWEFYLTMMGDVPASIAVDLRHQRASPGVEKPMLVHVRVPMRTPRVDGLATPEEAPALLALEDALSRALAIHADARFVGRLTARGFRELFFYGDDSAAARAGISAVADSFPDYPLRHQVIDDPSWSTYAEVLLPDDDDRGWIEDRRRVEALMDRGTALDVPHRVVHELQFSDEACARAMPEELGPLGFEVGAPLPEGKTWRVSASRPDRIELDHIHAVAQDLRRRLTLFSGEHRGWTLA